MIDNTYGSAYVGGRLASAFQLTLALLFSGSVFFVFFFNIPIGFFNGNTNIIYWKQYGERLHKIFCILFYEVFDWEENKEVGAICFELEIPKKKNKKK